MSTKRNSSSLAVSESLRSGKRAKEGDGVVIGSRSRTDDYSRAAIAKTKPSYPSPNITTLYGVNGKPVGWIFAAFYHLRDFVKALANKNGATTHLGNTDFKAFTNLSYAFFTGETMLGMNLWVIRIDGTKENLEGSFVMDPKEVAAGYANKIARAVGEAKTFGPPARSRLTVGVHDMSKEEEDVFASLCIEFDRKRLGGWQTSEADNVTKADIAPGPYEDLF